MSAPGQCCGADRIDVLGVASPGATFARVGLWISVLSALGYWAYFGALYFAVCRQADDFTRRWFQHLADGKFNYAFIETQPPQVSRRVNFFQQAHWAKL
jgi:hypothetical protein